MLAKIFSGTTIGLEGVLIEVEVDVADRGFPTFTIVGLPNKAIDEAKDRVRTAIVNANFEMPDSRLTVNLAPADIPKEGSLFDLPIAVGILSAGGMLVQTPLLKESLFIGELSLKGEVRKVPGVISIAIMAKEKGIKNIFLPSANAVEASVIDGVNVYPIERLTDLILHINGDKSILPHPPVALEEFIKDDSYPYDFSEIKGQEHAKRALEISSAGFHNVHLKGPPGAGKTMLARAFPSILPPMDKEEILEVSKIYSVAGELRENSFIAKRPFRAPHHTTSRIGLIGGGSRPKPGEISLAHRGVLFLDEFPEFPRSVLESLRQPLEDGVVTISRAFGSLTFPARFLLLSASNPCPCGFLGHPKKACRCLPGAIAKYKKRLSGPILDRIDLHIDVPPVENEKLWQDYQAESSEKIRERVILARERQKHRFKDTHIKTNSEMSPRAIKKFCRLEEKAEEILKKAVSVLSLSARAYFKIIKISQTIADLEGEAVIKPQHIAEALQYRETE